MRKDLRQVGYLQGLYRGAWSTEHKKACYRLETARFVAAPSEDSVSVSPLFTLQWKVTFMNERKQEH
jgi:hypothetical protein